MHFFEDTAAQPCDLQAVRAAEATLGVVLPPAYVDLLLQHNGGVPRHRRCPTPFPTSWDEDHFQVSRLLGVGGDDGIDSQFGSAYMVAEWGYPDVGVVLFDTPSGGHDTVMLDYRRCGPTGEPAVVYVDEDRVPREVAPTFAAFIAALEPPIYDDL